MPSLKKQNPNIDEGWFKNKLLEKQLTVRGLAKQMGLNPSTVSLMLRGIRSIHNEDAVKLAEFFSVTPIEIFKRAGAPVEDEVRKIPVAMYIDENNKIIQVPTEVADKFKAPYDCPTNSYALQIRTGRVYDGWMMVVAGNKVQPESALGALCVYCTKNGVLNLGILRRGYVSGTYNSTQPTYYGTDDTNTQNIDIAWCQNVLWIKPTHT